MIPLYTSSQIREIDSYAINRLNYPSILLMENAAKEISDELIEIFDELKISTVGVLCGKGNNGGDGFAVARHLANSNFNVLVIHTGDEKELKGDSKTNYLLLKSLSGVNKNLNLIKYTKNSLIKLKKCDALIDAMLGNGAKGVLKEPYKEIVLFANKTKAYKVAIDIPTGLDADKGTGDVIFNSDLVITLAGYKPGLFIEKGYENSKEVIRKNIGINLNWLSDYTPAGYLIEPEDALKMLPEKKKTVNKYSNGKVLTIAGSIEYPGAASLTSSAILSSGAGASILMFPEKGRGMLPDIYPEVVVKSYKSEGTGCLSLNAVIEMKKWLDWGDVIALGPGLGRDLNTIDAVVEIVKKYKNKLMVIDADALFPFSNGEYKKYNLKNKVLTPHHKEFASLLGIKLNVLEEDVLLYGEKFAKDTGAYLVLKGAPTIVFTPKGERFVNTCGNPGLAKFGSGDTLTGIISGLLAQTKDIFSAIISGVYIHSFSADILAVNFKSFAYTAKDVLVNIPETIKFLRNSIA